MTAVSNLPPDLPTMAELGHDLLASSTRQRILAFGRPGLCVALYALFATLPVS